MLDVYSLVPFINYFEHTDWLYLERHHRQNQLPSVEKQNWILALAFYFYLGLLDIVSFLPIVYQHWELVTVDPFLIRIEGYVDALPRFGLNFSFPILHLET